MGPLFLALVIILLPVAIALYRTQEHRRLSRSRVVSVVVLLRNGPLYSRELARLTASANLSTGFGREGFLSGLRAVLSGASTLRFVIRVAYSSGSVAELQPKARELFDSMVEESKVDKLAGAGGEPVCLLALVAVTPAILARRINRQRIGQTLDVLSEGVHSVDARLHFFFIPGPEDSLRAEEGSAAFARIGAEVKG